VHDSEAVLPAVSVTDFVTVLEPTLDVSKAMFPVVGPLTPEPPSVTVQVTDRDAPSTTWAVGQVVPNDTIGVPLSTLT
jgi:hypothetical protein